MENEVADEAADLGWRRQPEHVMDTRRNMQQAVKHLHRFFVAVAETVVDDDGKRGTAPDPQVSSSGAVSKKARTEPTVREFAWLPGPTWILLRGLQSWTDYHINSGKLLLGPSKLVH